MAKYNTFSDSLLQPGTKILRPRISFRVKATDIENKYDLLLF